MSNQTVELSKTCVSVMENSYMTYEVMTCVQCGGRWKMEHGDEEENCTACDYGYIIFNTQIKPKYERRDGNDNY